MAQKIEYIKVRDLVLWTENPRDPIVLSASDDDVIRRAITDPNNKWDLKRLARDMGDYYDFSELPIVVYKKGRPIVYDGNRRIVLAKIRLGFASIEGFDSELPDVPLEIPCNVCSEDVALKSVYRKHVALRNSWGALERDIFAHKYLNEDKSIFLLFDECTGGFISKNPEMNQGFIRKEVLTEALLFDMGFKFENGCLRTRHSDEEVSVLLDNLLEKVKDREISTRGDNRGKPIKVLDKRVQDIINANSNNEFHNYSPITADVPQQLNPQVNEAGDTLRKTRIAKVRKQVLFGEKLVLKRGNVNNLYSDILSLYDVVSSDKRSFSPCINGLFRMSFRLLCETASQEMGYNDIKDYVNKYYPQAKKSLSKDVLTLLSSQNVKCETLPQLLHTGAHNYIASTSADQAICISIALGAMLKISHGKC